MPFLPLPALPPSDRVRIEDRSLVHHLVTVLRVRPGEVWTLVTPDGRRARAVVEDVAKRAVELRVVERIPDFPAKGTELVVATALPKNAQLGTLVRGLTEAGVDRLVPLVCRRSVAGRDGRLARERLERLAEESLKQCGQPRAPHIEAPRRVADLGAETARLVVCAAPDDAADPASWFHLARTLSTDRPWWLVLGPEGGFADDEREALSACGAHFTTLGPMVYRLEHAALVAAGIAAARLFANEHGAGGPD